MRAVQTALHRSQKTLSASPKKTGRTNCGESGIRTHDTLLGYTHFPGAHLQPLGHFSLFADKKQIFNYLNIEST